MRGDARTPGTRIEVALPRRHACTARRAPTASSPIALPVDPGRHQLHISASDDAGNRLERQRLMRYDDAAPELVVRGAKGWSTESTPLIMGILRDTSGRPSRRC